MRHLIPMGALAALLIAAPGTAEGQRVSADVVVRSGPVRGRVVIGDRPYAYRYDLDRRWYGHRYAPRHLRVHRIHVPRGRAHGWWKRHGYRPMKVYYHAGRFYHRHDFRYLKRRGLRLRPVVVWQRGGRLYRPVRGIRRADRHRRAGFRDDRYEYDDDRYEFDD
ncbi:MAG: hypothetical protein HKM89_06815 [Gemmatimonadales bacterium]|nr:hypothetical protein [Gemmatimonadales bacterium]